jgi:hypothetical protein
MLAELQTGPQSVSGSAKTLARAGQQGDLIVSELHGKYYEQVVRGKCFSLCTQGTGVTTTRGARHDLDGPWRRQSGRVGLQPGAARLHMRAVRCRRCGHGRHHGRRRNHRVHADPAEPPDRRHGRLGDERKRWCDHFHAGPDRDVRRSRLARHDRLWPQAGISVDIAGAIIVPPGSFIARTRQSSPRPRCSSRSSGKKSRSCRKRSVGPITSRRRANGSEIEPAAPRHDCARRSKPVSFSRALRIMRLVLCRSQWTQRRFLLR